MVDVGIPKPINGWIVQRTSELEAGHHALNSSRFPSRFDRAPVYADCQRFLHRNSTKFSRVVVDSIPHNSTESIVKTTLEEAVAADTSSLFRKTAQSLEGNVDVEPASSIDDSSMILIEIRVDVDVDEGPHPNMTIGDRAQSLVEPR